MTPGGRDCAHCGLPLPRRPARVVLDGRSEACCCYGCVLALTVTRGRGEGGAAAALLVRLGVAVFFTMNVMMVTMPTYAPAIYGSAHTDGPWFTVLRALGVLLATPVLVLLGGPVLAAALRTARSGLGVDALVVVGTFAAYGLSVWHVIVGRPEVYVDTACMLLVLVTAGRYLEAQAKADAGAAVRAVLGPADRPARRLAREGVQPVDPAALAIGERVVVTPGDAFPTDGVVESGEGGVDEAMLTGESTPRLRAPGDEVSGGSCSVDGRFVVRVTRPQAESTAARIAALVRAALGERTHAERLADRAAAWLGPLTIIVALGAGGWWAANVDLGRGVLVALSALVVACPCALGIATPAAMWTAVAAAADRGIVLRSAPVLERLAGIRRVLFDRTGTLTRAIPDVAAVVPLDASAVPASEVLRLAAALEVDVPHPYARALVAAARTGRLDLPPVARLAVVPGRGVTGVVAGRPVTVGDRRLLLERGVRLGEADAPDAASVWVALDDRAVGRIDLADGVEPDVPRHVAALRTAGLGVGLVTGAARASGLVPCVFAPGEAACGMLPAEKIAAVRRARTTGAVAMVGDGLNDAPALAAADVGIAVARATDLTRVAADVVLLRPGVAAVPWLVAHARRTVRVARQNLAWAFAYNAGALVLAAAGALTPVVAALAMLASSATVIANARRLRGAGRSEGSAREAVAVFTDGSLAAARS
jgi:Cu2+-exporting ATPase